MAASNLRLAQDNLVHHSATTRGGRTDRARGQPHAGDRPPLARGKVSPAGTNLRLRWLDVLRRGDRAGRVELADDVCNFGAKALWTIAQLKRHGHPAIRLLSKRLVHAPPRYTEGLAAGQVVLCVIRCFFGRARASSSLAASSGWARQLAVN